MKDFCSRRFTFDAESDRRKESGANAEGEFRENQRPGSSRSTGKGGVMRDHTVEISDKAGHVFRMSIQRPNVFGKLKDALAGDWVDPEATMTGIPSGSTRRFIKQTPGNWRVLEHGFIRYSSGKVLSNNTGADASTRDIFLLNMDGTWGTQLWDYEDALGVNDQGQGSITQPWVMGFQPGKFSWVLID